MSPKSPETLEAKVEQLLREHLAEQQSAVKAAVERAFASKVAPRASVRRRAPHLRRPSSEVAGIAEQLFGVVKAYPGEKMSAIAARLDGKARELHRPMMILKNAGRVRSAGERNATRYFPMVAKST